MTILARYCSLLHFDGTTEFWLMITFFGLLIPEGDAQEISLFSKTTSEDTSKYHIKYNAILQNLFGQLGLFLWIYAPK